MPTHPARLAAWRCPERAPGRLLRPTPFLPDLGRVCQETVVCIADVIGGPSDPWATRKRSKRGKRGIDGFGRFADKAGSAVLADLVAKRGIDGFGRFGAEAGNRPVCRKIGDHRRVFRFTGIGDSKRFAGNQRSWLSTCGAAELRCCCGRSVGLALLVCIRSTSRADPVQAVTAARSCDLRTSKQTAAMAAAICGAKVSEAQCFRGFAAESWRDVAHGRWAGGGQSWRLGR